MRRGYQEIIYIQNNDNNIAGQQDGNILRHTFKPERNLMTYKMVITMAKNLRKTSWQRKQKIRKVPFSTSKQGRNMGTSSPEMSVP